MPEAGHGETPFITRSIDMIPSSLFLAPFVVAQRMPHLIWEAMGGNPFGQRESTVMVSEKLVALQRGAFAAQRMIVAAAFESASAAMQGRPAEAAGLMLAAPAKATQAALQPAARRVGANARRLAR
jgi:hypothetical protein